MTAAAAEAEAAGSGSGSANRNRRRPAAWTPPAGNRTYQSSSHKPTSHSDRLAVHPPSAVQSRLTRCLKEMAATWRTAGSTPSSRDTRSRFTICPRACLLCGEGKRRLGGQPGRGGEPCRAPRRRPLAAGSGGGGDGMHHATGRPPGPHLVKSILASLSQGGVWGLAGSQRCHEACRVHACAAAAAGGHLQSPIAALQRQQDIWYATRADALFFSCCCACFGSGWGQWPAAQAAVHLLLMSCLF